MSFIASNAITNIRKMLEDTDNANYTWPDVDLLAWLNQGVHVMQGSVPEFRLNSSGDLDGLSATLTATDTVPLPDMYRAALEDYVCARAYEQDAGDTRDTTLAKYHYGRFLAQMGLQGAAGKG